MDVNQINKLLSMKSNTKNYSGVITSIGTYRKFQESSTYKPPTPNIMETFLGLSIKTSNFMPDNMCVFTNCRNQIVSIIKVDGDKVTVTEIEPEDFYNPIFVMDEDNDQN